MTPEPTPSVWTGLSNQSRATALFVIPTTVGPTFFAARTTGVLRASDRLASAACCWAAALELAESAAVPDEQPVNVTTDAASKAAAIRLHCFLCDLSLKEIIKNPSKFFFLLHAQGDGCRLRRCLY